jgi:hypothetical protein
MLHPDETVWARPRGDAPRARPRLYDERVAWGMGILQKLSLVAVKDNTVASNKLTLLRPGLHACRSYACASRVFDVTHILCILLTCKHHISTAIGNAERG